MNGTNWDAKQAQEIIESLQRERKDDQEKLQQYEKRLKQLQYIVEEEDSNKDEDIENIESEENQVSLKEAAEMATIDKEIAEEKLECLQAEMSKLQKNLSETCAELRDLRKEIEEKGENEVAHSALLLKKESESEMMRDALLKARSLVTIQQEEKEILASEISSLKYVIEELESSKMSLSEHCKDKQTEIEELKEQVDAAQGAEEIVEYLTNANHNLEKSNAVLREKLKNLEHLQDINEEIQQTSRETEIELKEELEKARVKLSDTLEKRRAMEKDIGSLKAVISKYKELAESLKGINGDLRSQLTEATSQMAPPLANVPEPVDFRSVYLHKKDLENSIECDLIRNELGFLKSHVTYLCSFMPESFLTCGGDHDSILMMLLIPRMISKIEVIVKHAKDKFAYVESVDMPTILSTYKVEESGFLCRLLNSLYSLQLLLRQFVEILNSCSVDLFQKLSGFYGEMLPQENNLDKLLELLKKDTLDDNSNIDCLNKSIKFFKGLYRSHLLNEKGNHAHFLIDCFKSSESTCNGIKVFAEALILLTGNYGFKESEGSLRDVALTNVRLLGIIRKIRRQIPQDKDSHELQLRERELQQIETHNKESFEAFSFLLESYVEIRQHLITYEEEESSIQHVLETTLQKKEYASQLKSAGTSIEAFHKFLLLLYEAITEGSRDVPKEEKSQPPPLAARSQTVKERIKGLENLLVDLEEKEMAICELKNNLLQKCEELNEMNIRRELSEKRHGSAIKGLVEKCRSFQNAFEESNAQKCAAEFLFKEKLSFLKREIHWLEKERASLKTKIQNAARKSYTLAQEISPKTCQETALIIQELEMLRRAIRHLQQENAYLSSLKLKDKMAQLPDLTSRSDALLKNLSLQSQLKELLDQSCLLLARPALVDLNHKRSYHIQVTRKRTALRNLSRRLDDLKLQVASLEQTNQCGAVDCDFSSFPRGRIQGQRELVAKVDVRATTFVETLSPFDGCFEVKSLDLDYTTLSKIHRCILEF